MDCWTTEDATEAGLKEFAEKIFESFSSKHCFSKLNHQAIFFSFFIKNPKCVPSIAAGWPPASSSLRI